MARKKIKQPDFQSRRRSGLRQAYARTLGKALVHAAAEGRLQRVASLLDAGADINGVFEYTALYRACALRQWGVARYLIERGATNAWRHANGSTAFDIAMNKMTIDQVAASETMLCMVRSGVALDANMNNGLSPVINALLYGDIGLANAMYERGAKIDLLSYLNETALVSVMKFCPPVHQKAALEFLIDRGADLSGRNADGRTALGMAKTDGKASRDVIDLLNDAPRRFAQVLVDAALKAPSSGARRKLKPK